MNIYQAEVERLDRRHVLVVRSLIYAGVAVAVIAVLWIIGFVPTWTRQMLSFVPTQSKPAVSAQVTSPAAHAGSAARPDLSAALEDGTASSISPQPKPLYLISTTPGSKPTEGTAQIGTHPKNPQTYGGGALLENGATLAEIHRGYVMLTRGNSSVKLMLYSLDAPVSRSSDPLLMVGGASRKVLGTGITHDVLTPYIRPAPVFEGETLIGYQVYPGPRAGVFTRLGLQAGDVIISIDGAALNEPHSAMQALQGIANGMVVTASIRRRNRIERITIDGSLLIADQTLTATGSADPRLATAPANVN